METSAIKPVNAPTSATDAPRLVAKREKVAVTMPLTTSAQKTTKQMASTSVRRRVRHGREVAGDRIMRFLVAFIRWIESLEYT